MCVAIGKIFRSNGGGKAANGYLHLVKYKAVTALCIYRIYMHCAYCAYIEHICTTRSHVRCYRQNLPVGRWKSRNWHKRTANMWSQSHPLIPWRLSVWKKKTLKLWVLCQNLMPCANEIYSMETLQMDKMERSTKANNMARRVTPFCGSNLFCGESS